MHKTKHPLFTVWIGMIRRCGDPRIRNYANYGGRGITVCERWRTDFWAFIADMGARPTPGHSIERIDNDGPYAPENCRWATTLEQRANTRRNKSVTFQGKTLTVTEWARRVGLHPATLFWRLRHGCSVQDALTVRPTRGRRVGQPSVDELLYKSGITRGAYYARLEAGWTREEALSIPKHQRRLR